ncbi:WhiB family transcriptional regulator [Rhodococcus sovatensis]|uniref:Transcriptional regulator WhiB n=1 Tax=Rhodococcus sovatensis TaxID=1805840 RepID=A0ABZ2PI64_9NOCA
MRTNHELRLDRTPDCEFARSAQPEEEKILRTPIVEQKLPPPLSSNWEWQRLARCRSMPVSIFFPPRGLRGHTLRYHEEEAKAVCALCEVVEECRQHALACPEPHGVWGGLSAAERVDLCQREGSAAGCGTAAGCDSAAESSGGSSVDRNVPLTEWN